MDHQIVNAQHARLSPDYLEYLIDHFFIGDFSQQGA